MASPVREGLVCWPDDVAARYRERRFWAGLPLGDELWQTAAARPAHPALVDGPVRLDYAGLTGRADAAATRLLGLGLVPGDRVLVQLPNCWQFVVLTLACLRAGVLPVMALPAHRELELRHLAGLAEVAAFAVPAELRGFDHRAMATRLAAELAEPARVLVAGLGPDEAGDTVDLDALCAPGPSGPLTTPAGEDVALFLLSGGTTGLPKLIARTHQDYAYNVRCAAQAAGLGADSVYLGALPASHNFPLACPGILGVLLVGGTAVMLASPEPERALATMAAERVTHVAAVPAVAQAWMTQHEQQPRHDLSRLRVLQVGGARLADAQARRVRPVFGCTLQQVFGMAEGLVCTTALDDPDHIVCGTQGRPMSPGDEVRLVGPGGADVAPGEPGSLLTRGPYTPRGYWRAPEQNARAFTPDGWYASGDVCRALPDGSLVVEGRDKDMINRGGEKVSAETVENLAYGVDGVLEAAAVAMPDDVFGERVCLFVVPAPGARLELEGVREQMRAQGVAAFVLPDRLELRPEIPKTKVGKIDKADLRGQLVRLDRHRPADLLPVVEQGSATFGRALARADLSAPSGLPGWSGAHLAAHVAANAEAIERLLVWGTTGAVTPMYTSPQQRGDDIVTGGLLPHDVLRARVAETTAHLADAFAAVPPDAWQARVRSARGRDIPLAEVVWMRAKEVWIHTLDLDPAAPWSLLAYPVRRLLLDDVAGGFSGRDDAPALLLRVAGHDYDLGPGGAAPQQVELALDDALGWLTGRVRSERTGPELPPWL